MSLHDHALIVLFTSKIFTRVYVKKITKHFITRPLATVPTAAGQLGLINNQILTGFVGRMVT